MDLKNRIELNRPLWWYSPFIAIIVYGAAYAYVNPATGEVSAFTTGQLIVLWVAREIVQSIRERRDGQYYSSTQYAVITVAAAILIPAGSIASLSTPGPISLVQGYVVVKFFLIIFTALPIAVYNHFLGEPDGQPTPS